MRKNFWIKFILALSLLIVLATLGLIKYGNLLFQEKYSEIQCDFNDCQGLCETGNGDVFLCAKNCVKLINKKGSERWSLDADFSEPIVCREKNILGISDIKTNMIYIYNLEGELYHVKSENQLLVFSVNSSGYCATISKSNDGLYLIDVYGASDKKIFTHVHSEENVFPVNVSVSPNNSIVCVNFIDVNNFSLNSKIIFFSMSSPQSDVFASFNIENSFIYKIGFLSKNNIIAFSEDQIIQLEFYSKGLKERWSQKFETKIDLLEVNNNLLAVKQIDKNIIEFYSTSGKKLGETELKGQINFLSISATKKYVIICTRGELKIVSSDGKILSKCNISSDQKFAAFLGSPKRILIGSQSKIGVLYIDTGV